MCIRDRYGGESDNMAGGDESNMRVSQLMRQDSGYSRILAGQAGQTVAARNKQENDLAIMQIWANEKLEGDYVVTDLCEDLKSGVILCRLCEKLTGKRFKANKMKLHAFYQDNVAKCIIVLNKMGCDVRVGAKQIVDGKPKSVLALLGQMQSTFDSEGLDRIIPTVLIANNDREAGQNRPAHVPAVAADVNDWNGDRHEAGKLSETENKADILRRRREREEAMALGMANDSARNGQVKAADVKDAWLLNSKRHWKTACEGSLRQVAQRRATAQHLWEGVLAWAHAEVAARTADGNAGAQGHLGADQLSQIQQAYDTFQATSPTNGLSQEYLDEFGAELFQRFHEFGMDNQEQIALAMRLAWQCGHSDQEDSFQTALRLLLGDTIKYVDDDGELINCNIADNELVLRNTSEVVLAGSELYTAQAAGTEYEEELLQLYAMGFTDQAHNIEALKKVSESPNKLAACLRYLA
eukprot:TRINITY_DN9571_c0_g1_i1.p1 TRINITY_DN9571_c0_g1~~TRINITY_DN9571_c0_g1_i1.p1  ORF type:complete len:468 (+),score=147.62 TRINITY_DN9571_c0_g1_i1:121-1524(+)